MCVLNKVLRRHCEELYLPEIRYISKYEARCKDSNNSKTENNNTCSTDKYMLF